jgi:hypothetical protein
MFFINTIVRLRNKKTGEILETTIGDLYEKSQIKRRLNVLFVDLKVKI